MVTIGTRSEAGGEHGVDCPYDWSASRIETNILSMPPIMKIQQVETELYHVPLARPMVDAIHGEQNDFSLIVVKITTEDGAEGMGYTYSVGQVGGPSIATLINDNLAPLLVGEDPRRFPLGVGALDDLVGDLGE